MGAVSIYSRCHFTGHFPNYIYSFDFNDKLSGSDSFVGKYPTWADEGIWENWPPFVRKQFGENIDHMSRGYDLTLCPSGMPDENGVVPAGKAAKIKLVIGEGELPMIPDIDLSKVPLIDLKGMMREYFISYFQDATGSEHSKVPWKQLQEDTDKFIDKTQDFLPPNVRIQDPSHMQKEDILAVLKHWWAREDNDWVTTIFQFQYTGAEGNKRSMPPKPRPVRPVLL